MKKRKTRCPTTQSQNIAKALSRLWITYLAIVISCQIIVLCSYLLTEVGIIQKNFIMSNFIYVFKYGIWGNFQYSKGTRSQQQSLQNFLDNMKFVKKTLSNICTHLHELMYDPIFLASVVLPNIHLVLNLRTSKKKVDRNRTFFTVLMGLIICRSNYL